MAEPASPSSLVDAGRALLDAAAAALPSWMARIVREQAPDASSGEIDAVARDAASAAVERLAAVLAADPDEQTTTPLAVVRAATAPLTAWLAARATPVPAGRDAYDAAAFPDDVYGLAPKAWVDVDPAVADAALQWGVAKAFEHRRRHAAAAPRPSSPPLPGSSTEPGSGARPAPPSESRHGPPQHRSRVVARPGGVADAERPVVAYVPDLMDRSRLAAAAPRTRFVAAPAELVVAAAGARLVVVDLSRPGVLDVLTGVVAAVSDGRVVGFGSHVDRDVLDGAARCGVTALPRSRFFARLGEVLSPG